MSIEAMKQALEALEDLYAEQNAAPLWKRQEHWQAAMDKANTAIPALRTAIEQAEKQEPVAYVQDLDEVKRKHLVYEKGMDWKDPLYTTPPAAQRQWVGLTDEERDEICLGDEGIAREIEAKLKEKNRGNHG